MEIFTSTETLVRRWDFLLIGNQLKRKVEVRMRGEKTNTNEKSREKERNGIKLAEKVREKKSGSGTHKA